MTNELCLFQTEICRLLIYRFLDVPEFQNVTLKCLTEIASISKENTREYQQVMTHHSL